MSSPDETGARVGAGEQELARYADELVGAAEGALGAWVEAAVCRRVTEWTGRPPTDGVRRSAGEAARQAEGDVLPRLRALLDADVDEQRSTPLSVLRRAVPYPTAVLSSAGVPPVVRDELAEAAFPDDDYDLSPTAFADLGPKVAEAGLHWGAAKAFVVLRRRRGGGA